MGLKSFAQEYVEQGFVVVPDVLSPHEVEEIFEDAARFARGEYPLSKAGDEGDGLANAATADEPLQQILAVHFPHWVSPVVQRAVRHPAVCEVLTEVVGAHLPWWDGAVKCMQSMLFVKPPGFPGQAWHQDERFIPTRDRSLTGVWIALDDATEENGCVRVVPRSHQPGVIYPARDHGDSAEFDPTKESYGFDASSEVVVEVASGSAVFFNGYLLHRSLRNRSNGYRRSLVNHYCSASTLIPWSATPDTTIAETDYRTIVPVVGDDPYAWKPIADPPRDVFLRARHPAAARPPSQG